MVEGVVRKKKDIIDIIRYLVRDVRRVLCSVSSVFSSCHHRLVDLIQGRFFSLVFGFYDFFLKIFKWTKSCRLEQFLVRGDSGNEKDYDVQDVKFWIVSL